MAPTTGNVNTAPRRSNRTAKKSLKALEIEAGGTMAPTNTAPAKVTKKTAQKKGKATATKAKAKAPPSFPNLPNGRTSAPSASDSSSDSSDSDQPTKAATTKSTKGKGKAVAAAPSKKGKAKANASAAPQNKGKGKAVTNQTSSKKRKSSDDEETDNEKSGSEAPPAKRAKKEAKPAKTKPTKAVKPKVVINHAPTTKLDVYVFGEGSGGELGLGNAKTAQDVKRPRLNAFLSSKEVGVVQVACGGMHCAALTHDGKVLTWGVNDQGALGRDTAWEGGLREIGESDSESADSDAGLNPHESTPGAVTSFPDGTVIVKLSAGDSHTLALTDDGLVYGWGTFRSNEGILGFNKDILTQNTPALLPNLSKIVDITSGSNHALALSNKGVVHTWGSGQNNQLGFRLMERKQKESLTPSLLRLRGKNIRYVACGADHSFAIDGKEQVWSWGVNAFGGTGIYEGAGEDNASVIAPAVVKNLKLENDTITHLAAGTHHSLASTANGQCLVWGRSDGSQTGVDVSSLADDQVIRDSRGQARILVRPTQVPGIQGCTFVAAGTDHSIALDKTGKAFTWGFSANYQTGQGTDEDIDAATMLNNTAVRDRHINWAGAGGQYSVITSPAVAENEDVMMTNGGEGPSSAAA